MVGLLSSASRVFADRFIAGRRYVNQLATALRLPQNAMEGAMQFYKVAIANNFIQGRRTKNVAAICLYIACRRDEQNRTMLIDFADVLMVKFSIPIVKVIKLRLFQGERLQTWTDVQGASGGALST